MKNTRIKVRKIAIWSDFSWCRLYEIKEEVVLKEDSDYKIIPLPRGMYAPTQEFLEQMVDGCFIEEF